jgi:hypothetical protein
MVTTTTPTRWAIGFNLSYRSILPWAPLSLGLNLSQRSAIP